MTLLQKIEKAKDIIRENISNFPIDKISIAFSGGKDSTVLLALIMEVVIDRVPRIDAVLSDTEFDDTHRFLVEIEEYYDVPIRRHFYLNDPNNPENASKENKTEKFKEVMADVDCWFSGIRRDEGATRKEIEYVEVVDGLTKVNPIADFTEKDIWRYLAINRIPVNDAYLHGYRSLSCRLSTVAEEDGAETERAGRWKGTENAASECGIHSFSLRG